VGAGGALRVELGADVSLVPETAFSGGVMRAVLPCSESGTGAEGRAGCGAGGGADVAAAGGGDVSGGAHVEGGVAGGVLT
jgi:hypothetical protein